MIKDTYDIYYIKVCNIDYSSAKLEFNDFINDKIPGDIPIRSIKTVFNLYR